MWIERRLPLPLEGRVAAKRPGGVRTAVLDAEFFAGEFRRLACGRTDPLWPLRGHLPLKGGEEAMTFAPTSLSQSWPLPANPRPIVTFGAGSIVSDAHFPAYQKAGFPVAGLYDPDQAKAKKLAEAWGVAAYRSVEEAASVGSAIFDLATPPERHADVLRALPDGAVVLIQKPMGANLDGATEILKLCRQRKLVAAVNFQLRFAPMMLALKDAIAKGWLGDVVDFDALLAVATPWQLWEFLLKAPRVEIAMHSIHYLDLIRQLLGDPQGVHAKTLGHPSHSVAQTRTSAILDYGSTVRCALSINHDHKYGRKYQACEFRISGTQGAAYLKLGLNLDYPKGEPDILEIYPKGGDDLGCGPAQGRVVSGCLCRPDGQSAALCLGRGC